MLKKLMITAPVDKVWATLTCDEHMKRWFSGADVQIDDLRPGGTMTLRFDGGRDVPARIVEVETERAFAYEIGEDPTDRHFMRVRFTLTPQGERTLLSLEESNSHQDKIKSVAESLSAAV